MNVYNFCAGPAMLPKDVMVKAQQELINWNNTGCSVMEVSHRSKEFIQVYENAVAAVRRLLQVPDDYSVLFMHGGGRGQFSAVPLNLLLPSKPAHYVTTGSWSAAAVTEASKFGEVTEQIETLNEDDKIRVKPISEWQVPEQASYLHYCPNETVDGIEVFESPKFSVPVVADMSSNIFSRVINIQDYDLIYAGAQKNIGPSGLSLVIVKKTLLTRSSDSVPSILNYNLTDAKDSMFNTPSTYAIYLAGLVFDWLESKGGVPAIETQNIEKAELLYDAIDNSTLYFNKVAKENRSRMNITFNLRKSELETRFLDSANQAGLVALKGHRSVGGMRASIYNAMPLEGVKALVEFMKEFELKHG